MTDADDAIDELIRAIQSGTTLAWAVRYASDGRDPLPAYWAVTTNAVAMQHLLIAGCAPEYPEVTRALIRHWGGSGSSKMPLDRCDGSDAKCCSDLIRKMEPNPPSLAVLLAVRI